MAEYVSVQELEARHESHGSVSVLFVLLASVLIGGGLFLIAAWVLSFDWLYFTGVAPVAIGFLLLFSPKAGPDH